MKNIVIIGPPGSGKDTQIEELSKYIKFELISSGDIVRKIAETNKKCRNIMDKGGLIDDKTILSAIDKQLKSIGSTTNVVFDGFPRTLHQAEAFSELLMHHNRVIDKVIYIELDEAVIVDRLSRRMICSICGHNIHPGSEKCADCGGRPIRRHDDEPAVIINRVQTYLENTLPLVNYYRNKGINLEVNGDQSISAVAKDIKEGLGDDFR